MKGFVLAGTNSGCGKTTVSIGLMSLLKSKGLQVAPFKTGPDYIDPLFHQKILDTPSYNLDTYMLPSEAIQYLFSKHCISKDIAVIEGVMGMYDGKGEESQGSTHELSQQLNLPVVLVVNCKGLYQSVGAIVKGFVNYKSNSSVKGVILNHCSSKEYYNFLKGIIEKECGVKCVGYVPFNKDFSLESRHLGLVQAEEVEDLQAKVQQLTQHLADTIDVNALLEISELEPTKSATLQLPDIDLSDLHIGVAYDKAFRFYYRDNLELLQELGATLHYFSPLSDRCLPNNCNCLYIGGGYPEVFATQLSANSPLLQHVNEQVQKGLPVYAECGGLMYLTQKIISLEGEEFPMTGIYNTDVQMTKRLQRFGYAQLEYNGISTRCHEFHHSDLIEDENHCNYIKTYQLSKTEKLTDWQCGLLYKNCLAGYAHNHFYSNFEFFKELIKLWRSNK
nr:cobyrinate a,c-diamide synthase [uncultured Carboxylicivirga sp.]